MIEIRKIQKKFKFIIKNENIITKYLSFLIPFFIYFTSLPKGVTWGDSPELANAAITSGVAHPSGYPLFSILAKIFSLLPFNSPAFGINLMDAILEAGAVVWVYLIIRILTKKPWISLLSACFLSVTYTFWMHGRIIEVYALNNFLITGILYFMIQWILLRKIKYLVIMSILFGLSFTNHLTTVLFFPAVLFMFIATEPKKLFLPKYLSMFLGIIIGLQLLYFYIPVCATFASGKTMAWNNPDNFNSFIYHLTGKEYSVFRKGASFSVGLNRFIMSFNREFTPLGIVLVLLGGLELIAFNWRIATTLALYFISMVFYNSTYAVQDISSYYMAPYIVGAIALGVGTSWLFDKRKSNNIPGKYLAYAIPLFVLITTVGLYLKQWDIKYKDNLADSFASQSFAQLPEKSILMTDIDGPSFAMWYQAFSIHPDENKKVMVTKGMYSDKGKVWYRDFLRKKYPFVNWPVESGAAGTRKLISLVKRNYGKIPIFAVFYFRVRIPGFSYINRGWISEIVKNSDVKGNIKPNKNLRWSYLTSVIFANKKEWYAESTRVFHPGNTIGCVAEWIHGHKSVNMKVNIVNPDGKIISSSNRQVSKFNALSTHKFLIKSSHIRKTPYSCNIYLNGQLSSSLKFKVE